MNNFGLSERDIISINQILAKYSDVKSVYIFGSRAKGNYKPSSDIDLAILSSQLNDKTLIRLLSDFEDSSLPYFVDIVDYNTIKNQEIKQHIDRVGILFYTNNK